MDATVTFLYRLDWNLIVHSLTLLSIEEIVVVPVLDASFPYTSDWIVSKISCEAASIL